MKDLGIHTEMLTDGIVELYRQGLVTGARKTLDPGKVVYTFALGSQALYRTIDRNPDLLCCAVDYTNLPHIIMQNDRVVSINNTTQIDLQGQAASESDGHRHISGTGGQLQFVRGAYASEGGKSFICLSSTYEKRGERRSRIVPTPHARQHRHHAAGGHDVRRHRIRDGEPEGQVGAGAGAALISIAHPDFREELERAAHGMGMLPRALLSR